MRNSLEINREEFDSWFNKTFPLHLFPLGESRDELENYTWLAWRDSQRAEGQPARKGGE